MNQIYEQYSPEWFGQRLGKITASNIYKLTSRLKKSGERTKEGQDLILDKVAERITQTPQRHFVTDSMTWGIETEAQAAEFLAKNSLWNIQECGFFDHPRIPLTGASPDRLIDDDGVLEIKCPTSKTHLKTLMYGKDSFFNDGHNAQYLYQIYWQLACTGRNYCVFYSFDPYFSEELRGHSILFTLDDFSESFKQQIIDELALAEQEISENINRVLARFEKWEVS